MGIGSRAPFLPGHVLVRGARVSRPRVAGRRLRRAAGAGGSVTRRRAERAEPEGRGGAESSAEQPLPAAAADPGPGPRPGLWTGARCCSYPGAGACGGGGRRYRPAAALRPWVGRGERIPSETLSPTLSCTTQPPAQDPGKGEPEQGACSVAGGRCLPSDLGPTSRMGRAEMRWGDPGELAELQARDLGAGCLQLLEPRGHRGLDLGCSEAASRLDLPSPGAGPRPSLGRPPPNRSSWTLRTQASRADTFTRAWCTAMSCSLDPAKLDMLVALAQSNERARSATRSWRTWSCTAWVGSGGGASAWCAQPLAWSRVGRWLLLRALPTGRAGDTRGAWDPPEELGGTA